MIYILLLLYRKSTRVDNTGLYYVIVFRRRNKRGENSEKINMEIIIPKI